MTHSHTSALVAATRATCSRYDLIAIAASAGGITALSRLVRGLPAELGTPVVIVQHRSARNPEMLAKILARVSAVPVKLAEDGESLMRGTIYVAPPDYHVLVRPDRTLKLTDGIRIKHVLSSANPLFESAAEVLKDRVIVVVLTGSGTDATDGVQAVKEMGGIVIVQNPEEAEYCGMPESAIQSGAVDFVLPLDGIAPLLARLVTEAGETGLMR